MPKFPEVCPACKSDKIEHHPATDETYEWVKYDCRAEILLYEGKKFEVNEDCRGALEKAVKKLNSTLTAA